MIDLFIGLFLATLIVMLFTTRLYMMIFWYSLNSIFLGVVALMFGFSLKDNPLIISGFTAIALKGLFLPFVLKYLSKKFLLTRQIEPNIKIQYSILLIPAIIVFAFYLTQPLLNGTNSHQNYISISISSMLISLILMLEHTQIAPKIIGFLSIENALFLLGVSATGGMPMLIELGIFFDLLMAVVVINLLFNEEGA